MTDIEFDDGSIFNLEHRNKEDDAWYTVRVVLGEGNADDEKVLIVKFHGFTAACDVKYTVGQFQTVAEVDELVKRFRPVSEQFQDRECHKVTEGLRVCAALSCRDDDLRYFDAVVEAVNQQAHVFTNGEEECMCSFILFWLHGPNSGNLTAADIGHLCNIQANAQVDPDIYSFAKLAKQKIEIASSQCCLASKPHASASRGPASCELSCLSYNAKFSSESRWQENGTADGSGVKMEIEGLSSSARACRYGERSDSDEDLGGNDVVQSDGLHFLLIDNLETDLSPSAMRLFIHENTFISTEAYIFPRRSSVPYTSGAIVSDSETKIKKILEFLINPEHIIVSARGRPWIITEKTLNPRTFGSSAHILALGYQFQFLVLGKLACIYDKSLLRQQDFKGKGEFQKSNINRELKVVPLGTEAYKTAKKLRELFVEFVDHENRIHKRLAFEETRILQSSQ